MANPMGRCGDCKGNFWPLGVGGVIPHPHLENPRACLKKKYTQLENRGPKNKPAGSPADARKKGGGSIRPRRRAYGPF